MKIISLPFLRFARTPRWTKVLRSRIAELLQLRSNQWTILDANLHRKEIDGQFDGRIASRLKRDGSWMVEIPHDVPDFWG